MRTLHLVTLLFIVALSGCDTAYFPRIVNYTNEDLVVSVAFGTEIYDTTIPAGKGAYLGMKNREIESIRLATGKNERVLDKNEIQRLGRARGYAVKSLAEIQKIE